MRLKIPFLIVLTLPVLTMLVQSCSSEGSNGFAGNNQTAPQSTNPSADQAANPTSGQSGGLNGVFVGELWISAAPAKRFNLATGQLTNVSDGEAYPSIDGSVYVEHLDEFTSVPDEACFNTPIYLQQINVKDSRSGSVLSSMLVDRDIDGPVRLAPDGQRVAMMAAAQDDCGSNNRDHALAVYSTNGNELFRGDDSMMTFDWLPGNLLAIIRRTSGNNYSLVVETAPGSYQFSEYISFTLDNSVLYIRGLRFDAAANRAVIEVVNENSQYLSSVSFREANIISLDFTESNFSSVFSSTRTDGQLRANAPVISPDGNWIIATHDYSSGGYATFYVGHESSDIIEDISVLPVPADSVTYIVPFTSASQPLPPFQFTESVRPIFAYNNGRVTPAGFNPLIDMSWTPSP